MKVAFSGLQVRSFRILCQGFLGFCGFRGPKAQEAKHRRPAARPAAVPAPGRPVPARRAATARLAKAPQTDGALGCQLLLGAADTNIIVVIVIVAVAVIIIAVMVLMVPLGPRSIESCHMNSLYLLNVAAAALHKDSVAWPAGA